MTWREEWEKLSKRIEWMKENHPETKQELWFIPVMDARVREIEAQLCVAKEALESIAYPIKSLEDLAGREGKELNGPMAYQLSQDPNYLNHLARVALSSTAPCHHEAAVCRIKEWCNKSGFDTPTNMNRVIPHVRSMLEETTPCRHEEEAKRLRDERNLMIEEAHETPIKRQKLWEENQRLEAENKRLREAIERAREAYKADGTIAVRPFIAELRRRAEGGK